MLVDTLALAIPAAGDPVSRADLAVSLAGHWPPRTPTLTRVQALLARTALLGSLNGR